MESKRVLSSFLEIPVGFYTMTELAAAITDRLDINNTFKAKFETVANPINGNIAVVDVDSTNLNFMLTLTPRLSKQSKVSPPVTVNPAAGGNLSLTVQSVTAPATVLNYQNGDVVTVYDISNSAIKMPYFFGTVASFNVGTGVLDLVNIQGIHGVWGVPYTIGVTLTAAPMIIQNELSNMMGFDGPNLLAQTVDIN
jgi:hypothetical protein